ncbi:MAG: hypothetical protein V7607_6320 [Solirubrobacteraceae bacterium]
MLFGGDLFDAIPFSAQPTVVVEGEDDDGDRKHYVGEIDWAYGLLVTPTCDMADQRTGEPAHPYRVLVPVLAFEAVCDALGTPEEAYGVMVFAIDGDRIAGITGFPRQPELFLRFGLSLALGSGSPGSP